MRPQPRRKASEHEPWDCTIGREVEYAPSPGRWFRGIVDAVP